MQIQRFQSYNIQSKCNNQQERKQNINFTGLNNISAYSKKSKVFLIGITLSTLIGTIAAPFVTYSKLSKEENHYDKMSNVLVSIASGATVLGLGALAFLFADKKCNSSNNGPGIKVL